MRYDGTQPRRWWAALSVAAVLLGLLVPGAGATGRQVPRIARSAVEEPVRLMVQLQGAPLAEVTGAGAEQEIAREHQGLRQQLRSEGINYQELHAHRQLFNGLTLKVKATDIGRIAALRGVAGVFVARKTQLPTPQLFSSVRMIGAPQAWAGDPAHAIPGVDGTGIIVAVIDTGKS